MKREPAVGDKLRFKSDPFIARTKESLGISGETASLLVIGARDDAGRRQILVRVEGMPRATAAYLEWFDKVEEDSEET